MPLREFLLVSLSDLRQRDAEGVRGDRQAPQDIAELLDQSVAIDLSSLKELLSNESEDFGRFLGKTRGCVEQTIAAVE